MTSAENSSTGLYHFNLPPSSGVQKIKIIADPHTPLTALLYAPEHNSVLALTNAEYALVQQASAQYAKVIQNLHQAQVDLATKAAQKGATNMATKNAQNRVQVAQQQVKEKLEALVSGSPGGSVKWYELHDWTSQEKAYYFVPGHILNLKEARLNYPLNDDGQHKPESAFESFKKDDGSIDQQKLKDAFQNVSFKIKTEWKLVDESGQLPSSTLVKVVAGPWLGPNAARLLNGELDTLDQWVAEINQKLKWQTQQYQGERDNAFKALEEDPFTLEAFGRAQRLCERVWGDKSPLLRDTYRTMQGGTKEERFRKAKIDEVKNKPLPPAHWDASAEANLMRYSKGITAGVEMDLKEFSLSAELKGELEFALAEAKLKGALYYPHDRGWNANPKIPVTHKYGKWVEFDHCLPGQPHFEWDSCFMEIPHLNELAEALIALDLIRKTLTDGKYAMVILGHADQSGPDDYNLPLSRRRAQIVYALLTRNTQIWLDMFKSGEWGDTERNYMREQIKVYDPLGPGHFDQDLVNQYFAICDQRLGYGTLTIPTMIPQEFALNYLIAKGESEPIVNKPGIREERNRRVEFKIMAMVEEVTEKSEDRVELGAFRLSLEGHVGGFAGVNLGVSAKLNINAKGQRMSLGNQDEETKKQNAEQKGTDGEGGFEGFAGAKVEAGVTGGLDWKAPKDKDDPNAEEPEFNPLGTCGVVGEGIAGLAAKAEFKIGYDRDIHRFIIKAKASLCVGFGAGGELQFTIDAKEVWHFIKLVYEQLVKADFSVVDFFDEDVYDRFVAWSYELMKQGLLFQGMAMRATIEGANNAVKVLELGQDLLDSFDDYVESTDNIAKLMDHIEEYPLQARFATPEVKGRVLYLLLYGTQNLWTDSYWNDVNGKREHAIRTLLTIGVVSKREYQEVLEHTLMQPLQSGRSPVEKARYAARVQFKLVEYMNDDEDKHALAHWWDKLQDPSDTCCTPSKGMNPFK